MLETHLLSQKTNILWKKTLTFTFTHLNIYFHASFRKAGLSLTACHEFKKWTQSTIDVFLSLEGDMLSFGSLDSGFRHLFLRLWRSDIETPHVALWQCRPVNHEAARTEESNTVWSTLL